MVTAMIHSDPKCFINILVILPDSEDFKNNIFLFYLLCIFNEKG